MIKKFLFLGLFTLIPVCLLVLLGFTRERHSQLHCRSMQVYVDTSCGNRFVKPEQLRAMIDKRFPELEGQPIAEGTLPGIRQLVESNPYVKRSAIYKTMEGDIKVAITQKRPLVRIIDGNGRGYYVDREGTVLPLSPHHTARVLLARGSLPTGITPGTNLKHIPEKEYNAREISLLQDLFKLAAYIDQDAFLTSWIDQVYVTSAGKFEMTPINGVHLIALGEIDNMEEKFNKLHTFYLHGIPRVGWHYYQRIDLAYDRQIVCTK